MIGTIYIAIFAVTLNAANAQQGPAGVYCYVCNDAESNEDCNKNPPILCGSNENTCQTEVRVTRDIPITGPKYRITKRCKQEQACLANMRNNNVQGGEFTQCNSNPRARVSVCRYCCNDQSVRGCNKDVKGISGPKCPAIEAPLNGRLDCDSDDPAQRKRCNVICDPFYVVTDPTAIVLKCQNEGTWSNPVPKCDNSIGRGQDTATCPLPKAEIANGAWQCTKKCNDLTCQADTKCTIICNEGFETVGASDGFCKRDKSGSTARWSSTILDSTCEAITCPQLAVANSQVICNGDYGKDRFKATCQILCNKDREYLLEGPAVYECKKDGKWSTGTSICRPKCPNLVIPMGKVTCDDDTYLAGVSCSLLCNAGYKPSKKTTSVLCMENGAWSDELSQCEEIQCPEPPPLRNGKLNCKGFSKIFNTNTVCSVTCENGYDLIGPATRKCLDSGLWSGTDPECFLKRCPQIDTTIISNGKLLCTGPSGTNVVGSSCTLLCNKGYYSVNPITRVCSTAGSWTNDDIPFTCRVRTCRQPVIQNGKYSCDNPTYPYETTCRPKCNSGYEIDAMKEIRCGEDGVWIGDTASCSVKKCNDIVPPTRGSLSCTDEFKVGSVCTVQCQAGYRTKGTSVTECLSDGWDSRILTSVCAPSCRDLIEPDNGGLTCSNWEGGYGNGKYNKICQTRCDRNFVAARPQIRVCLLSGYWSDETDPKCIVQCQPPPQTENGELQCIGSSQSGPQTEGTVCELICQAGYRSVGTTSKTSCQADRTWTYMNAKCERSFCNALARPFYGELKCSGSRLEDGTYPVGAECTVACRDRPVLKGVSNKRVCTNTGQWSGNDVVCPVDCLYVWGSWSSCNYRGLKSRKAVVLIPPKNGGNQCPQQLTRTEECCQMQYKSVGNSCFSFHCDNQTWASAEENCRKMGGSLAKIDTMLKQYILKDTLEKYNLTSMWIGLSRTNGIFTWTDGTALGNFDQWYELKGIQKQPDSYRNLENCGQIASGWPRIPSGSTKTFDWNDADCESHSNYICENQSGPCP